MNQKSLDKKKTEPKKPIKNMNKGGKRGKEDTLHCSPSTANVLLTEPKKLEWVNKIDFVDDWLEIDCEVIWGKKGVKTLIDFIQSLIQSTKEETIREIMGLECLKNEPDDDDAFAKDAEIAMDNYNRNQLRNQIKEQLNSLLKK
jgi:hypothetical protein